MSKTKTFMRARLREIARHDRRMGRPPGVAAAVLARGLWFLGRSDARDHAPAKEWLRRNRPRAKSCFQNAQAFCCFCDAARYFEGFVVGDEPRSEPVHHAWVLLDGVVVDFTFEAMERKARREAVRLDTLTALYFGVGMSAETLRRHLARGYWGPAVA